MNFSQKTIKLIQSYISLKKYFTISRNVLNNKDKSYMPKKKNKKK